MKGYQSRLFDRVQNDTKISDFRKYIHKNVNIYHSDHHKRNILMFTAQNYHLEVFVYLVRNYPKLMLKTDDIDMNIMHYIASSNTDDESMVELITNKKFCYNKLVWMRNKDGLLPKDIAKQKNNKCIIKTLESIMHDTWAEYSYIARNNNNNNNNKDMDIDKPQQHSSIISRKRRHQTDDDDNMYKRRKLNGLGYLRTTPQQPTLSPSPLPPLPPIQLSPFTLNVSSDSSTPSTNSNEMEEIANTYYNGANISNEQFLFCRRFVKRFGGNEFLKMLIEKGYDDLSKCKVKTLNGFNNIGGIETNGEMDRFNNRMRGLQLTDRMDEEDDDIIKSYEWSLSEDDDL